MKPFLFCIRKTKKWASTNFSLPGSSIPQHHLYRPFCHYDSVASSPYIYFRCQNNIYFEIFPFCIVINRISNIICKKKIKLFGFHSYICQGFWDWTRMQKGPDYALFNRATYGNLSTHKHWIREPKGKAFAEVSMDAILYLWDFVVRR